MTDAKLSLVADDVVSECRDNLPARSDEAHGNDESASTLPLEERLTSEIIRDLQAGRLDAASLDGQTRLQCIELLTGNGFTTGEIAQIIGVSERTVRRDRQAIRRDHAVAPGRTLGDEMLGELQRITERSIERLTRLCSDRDTPALARVRAEQAIVRQYQNFIDTAHRLRYLESGSARLAHLRAIDPEEAKRRHEKVQALRKGWTAMSA